MYDEDFERKKRLDSRTACDHCLHGAHDGACEQCSCNSKGWSMFELFTTETTDDPTWPYGWTCTACGHHDADMTEGASETAMSRHAERCTATKFYIRMMDMLDDMERRLTALRREIQPK